jgi:glycosyltransferase involved in cell wall biosynthesis
VVGASERTPGQDRPPSLSVIVPVYNEQDWIGRCVESVRTALDNAGWPAEIVVVDDGSTDETPKRLAELAERTNLRIVSQENRGRFAARRAGLAHATGDQVLLLDSRVIVGPRSLAFLREQLVRRSAGRVWNGHIEVDPTGSPYGQFWAGLVSVGWRRYFADPRLVSFGADEFDLFPKGTGFFSAPRDLLLAAGRSFSSLFDDIRFASDDTRMLRWIAERERIHLAPEFTATYYSRDSLQKFVRHARFRGTTFVDGYLDSPGPVRRLAVAAAGAGLTGLVVLTRRPRAALALSVGAMLGAGLTVRRCGGTPVQARAVAALLPLFAACFGSGVLRGLVLALRTSLRR